MGRHVVIAFVSGWCLAAACTTPPSTGTAEALRKVEIDLSQLDPQGMRGPESGKVALSYEFSIPNKPEHKTEVLRIDPTIRFVLGSPGRVGAGPEECLCIGLTSQKGFRKVLEELARLPYTSRIIECHFE